MVELRNGDKYIVTSEDVLSSIINGHIGLSSYNENMFIIKKESDDYKNDEYDIIEVYSTDNYGNYKCIWNREKDEILTKEYVIEQIDTSAECESVHWDIKISPNSYYNGYGKADGNMQIVLSNVDEDDNLFLSIQGAKEMIKALNEIIDYLEE